MIGTVDEDCTIRNLCFMTLARLEFNLAFQIYIMGSKETLVKVGINCTNRKFQLRMIRNNLIRRMSLFNERRNDSIHTAKFMLCQVYTGS